jgi:hypothetical protein
MGLFEGSRAADRRPKGTEDDHWHDTIFQPFDWYADRKERFLYSNEVYNSPP